MGHGLFTPEIDWLLEKIPFVLCLGSEHWESPVG